MQRIAIDIGYGDTKVVCGDKEFKFPSAIEREKESAAEYASSAEDVYIFDGKKYVVGERASYGAVSTRGFNFLVKYSPLIIYHAIKKACIDTSRPIEIATGLSIVNWNDKEQFISSISKININNEIFEPNVVLMAQGQGVFEDYKENKDGLVCIVDIGYNTLDFLVFEDCKPKTNLSFATKQGVNRIVTELQTKLQKKFSTDLSEQAVKDIFIKGYILNFGEKIDLSDEISSSKEEYRDFIIDELKSKRLDLLQRSSKVIFAGGGAYFLGGVSLPKNTVFSATPYEFANVRGYYNG